MMHQMAVCEKKWCDYLVYVTPTRYGLWRVHYSEGYWQAMLKYLDKYATCLQDDIKPTMLKLRQSFLPYPKIEEIDIQQ